MTYQNQTALSVSMLFDHIEIQDVVCAVTLHSDLNEPEKALAQYTEDAIIDYSSVTGADDDKVPVKVHRDRLQTFLPDSRRGHRDRTFAMSCRSHSRQRCDARAGFRA
jgi:hypothetical protein